MTLGRTADNAIKIKVDNGTTRAVNCACCGVCGCVSVAGVMIDSQLLSDILDSATTGKLNGSGGVFFWNTTSDGWNAALYSSSFEIAAVGYTKSTKILCANSDNSMNAIQLGKTDGCCVTGATCTESTMNINGHSFIANQLTFFGSPYSAYIDFS